MAIELASAYVSLVPSAKGIAAGISKELGGPLEQAGRDSGDETSKSFGEHFKSGLATAAKAGALVLGAGLAVGVKLGKDSIKAASDLGESTNAVNVIFGEAATGVLAIGNNAAKSLGLSKAEFNGLAVQMSSFAQTIAGPGGDVTATLGDMTTRAADFASVMNLDVGDAAAMFQSGLAGETEPLRKYGLDLSAAAVETYALANGIGTAGEQLSESEKVTARYGLLMASTSKVQGDFANTSDGLANQQRIMAASFENSKAAIGTALMPVLALVMPVFQKLAEWLGDKIPKAIEFAKTAFDFLFSGITGEMTGEGEGFLGFLNDLGGKIYDIVAWVKAHWPQIKAVIVGAFDAIKAAVSVVIDWIATVVVAVFDVIKTAIAAAAVWIRDHWEQIKSVVVSVFDAIKTAVAYLVDVVLPAVVDGLKAAFGWLMDNKEFLIGIAAAIAVGLGTMFAVWAAGAIAAAAATVIAAAPFIALGLAIAGIVGGIIYAYNHFETFRNIVDTVARFLRDVVWPTMKRVFAAIVAAVTATVAWVRDHWDQIKAVFQAVGRFLSNVVWPIYRAVFTAIVTAVTFVVKFVIDHWGQISGVFEATARFLAEKVWPVIKRVFDDIVGAVEWAVDLISDHWGRIKSEAEHVFNFVRDVITAAFTVIRTVIETTISVIVALWDTFGATILSGLQTAWDLIVGALSAAWDLIRGVVQGGIDIIKGIIETVVSLITGDWEGAWNGIKEILSGIWEQIKAVVQAAIDAVKLIISGVWAAIKLQTQIAWDAIKLVVSTVWDLIKGVVSGAIDAVVGFVTAIPGRISGVFATLWDGLKNGMTTAKDWIRDRINDVVGFATGLPGRIAGAFGGMWDGIKNAFRSAINTVIGWWNGLHLGFPGYDIPGPGPNIPGFDIRLPQIQKLHSGGIVPGGIGQDVPIVARAGELVLTAAQQSQLFAMANGSISGAATTTINNYRRDIGVADLNQVFAMQRLQ